MIKEIMYKIFGVEPSACPVCEVLREQLYKSEAERKELLQRALAPPSTELHAVALEEEMKPIGQTFVPWRVRQQMLEAEDRKKAQLLKDRKQEIDSLEKELEIASEIR